MPAVRCRGLPARPRRSAASTSRHSGTSSGPERRLAQAMWLVTKEPPADRSGAPSFFGWLGSALLGQPVLPAGRARLNHLVDRRERDTELLVQKGSIGGQPV